ncbi:hypothetical protein J4426_01590 [Candidatus Woesearchaeota archaeon]|nr:hypothetical protein [Candidatus Woesearchaeota archaeon]
MYFPEKMQRYADLGLTFLSMIDGRAEGIERRIVIPPFGYGKRAVYPSSVEISALIQATEWYNLTDPE